MVNQFPAPLYHGEVLSRDRIDNFIPNRWIGEIRYYRDRMFHLANTIKTIAVIGKKGDEWYQPLVGRAEVYDRIPGQPVRLQARTPGQYSVKVTKDKESSFGIDKIVSVQSQYDLRTPYTREAGYAMQRDLDNFLLGMRAAIPANRQIFRSTGAGAGTAAGDPAPLDSSTIEAAIQFQLESEVPLSECKWVFSPNQVMDLITIDKFISTDYNLANIRIGALSSGVVGTLYGLPVHCSTQISNNSLDGYISSEGALGEPTPGVIGSRYLPDQDPVVGTGLPRGKTGSEVAQPFQTGMLVHPEWGVLLKQQNINVEASREVLLQMDALVTTQVYGAKLYRQDHAVLIHSRGSV